MAIRSTSTNKGGSTSMTVNAPSGTADGDVLVVGMIYATGTEPITPPSGWTSVYDSGNIGGAGRSMRVYTKVAASEGASWAWGLIASSNFVIHAAALSGMIASATPNANGGQTNGSSTSVTAPSITTTASGCNLVGFFGIASATTFSPASGMTEQQDDVQSDRSIELATEILGSSGSTGTRVATAGVASVNAGWIGAFAPIVSPSSMLLAAL